MKKHVVILAVSLLLLGTISIFAQGTNSNGNLPLSQEAIDNYIVGVQSDNLGLKVSCAYFLGEYKVSEAIIPLMKILHSDKSDVARIVAALSLTKIGSDKSVFAVKQAARFDESERVRSLCAKFYNSYTYMEQNQVDQF